MNRVLPLGTTSYIATVKLRSATTGQLLTGVAYGSVTYSYWRDGAASGATGTCVSATKGAYTDHGWVETDYAGVYQFGVPNAVLAAGVSGAVVKLSASGAIDAVLDIQLISVTRGLSGTALPDVAAGVNGGLPLGDASGRVDLGKWKGTAPLDLASQMVQVDVQAIDGVTANATKLAAILSNVVVDSWESKSATYEFLGPYAENMVHEDGYYDGLVIISQGTAGVIKHWDSANYRLTFETIGGRVEQLYAKDQPFVILPICIMPWGLGAQAKLDAAAAVDAGAAGKKIVDCPIDSETKRLLVYSQPPADGAEGPGYLFELELEPLDGKVVTEGNTSEETVHVLDADVTTITHTNATIGTRYRVKVNVLRNDPAYASIGANPPIEFTSLVPSVGQVDSQGIIDYVSDGNGIIKVTSPKTEGSPARTVQIAFTSASTGGGSTKTVEYDADAFSAADHALILYNAGDTTMRDAYLSLRPGLASAGTLGLTGMAASPIIDAGDVESLILTPVYNYLTTHAAVRNIVLLRGLPSRDTSGRSIAYLLSRIMVSHGGESETHYRGVIGAAFLRAKYPGLILTSVLDAGSDAATLALIQKMKSVADAGGLSADGITISAAAAGLGGDKWIIDSKRTSNYLFYDMLSSYDQFLEAAGIESENIVYQEEADGDAITSGTDVTYLSNWGLHNGVFVSTWPVDGSVILSGKSNWFAVQVEESLCGQIGGAHSDPVEHFAADAYGGTGYSHTPICMIGYTSEPYIAGLETRFFACAWAAGRTAAEAAFAGENSNKLVHFGDPWIVR
jgi:hypothetical protein